MILCIDVGNSHLFCGVFENDKLLIQFRYTSKKATSDEIGIFLKSALHENEIDFNDINSISICSVVPQLDYSLRSACFKYLNIEPFFLSAGIKTGLTIQIDVPSVLGADLIATAIAGTNKYHNQNLIIIDLGTAITFCPINKEKEFLGVVILPGIRLSMESLQEKTAQLPTVEVLQPELCLGKNTIDSIQSGLYYGTLGAIKEIISNLKQESFLNQEVTVVATGGFANLFKSAAVFDVIEPNLVLEGLKEALAMNLS